MGTKPQRGLRVLIRMLALLLGEMGKVLEGLQQRGDSSALVAELWVGPRDKDRTREIIKKPLQ